MKSQAGIPRRSRERERLRANRFFRTPLSLFGSAMERDFLGTIGRNKEESELKDESGSKAESDYLGGAPATQLQFHAKAAGSPAFMSFRPAREDSGDSFSGFRQQPAVVTAGDSIKRHSSPWMPHHQSQFGFDAHVSPQQYSAVAHAQGNDSPLSSFTLRKYADGMDTARKAGFFKNSPQAGGIETQAAVLRYLHTIDPTGENVKSSDKISATEHCNCTVAHVEHALARFTWAREAHKKQLKLREEGIPVPRTHSEMQKYMDKTPLDVLRSNLAKSDLIKRNAVCPCGSTKQYKRCCGASKR